MLVPISFALTQDNETVISNIKDTYNNINSNIHKFSTKQIILDGYSAEGGSLITYYDKEGKIIKMTAEYLGETGRASEEFYLENESLCFILRRNEFYNHPIYQEGDIKVARTEDDRFYFANGKLMQWIDSKKKVIDPKSQEFKEEEKEIIKLFGELFTKAKSNTK